MQKVPMKIQIPDLNRSLIKLNYDKHTIRFWSLTYMFLYLAFGYVDVLSAPVNYKAFWMVRALVLPFFLLALLSTCIKVISPYRLFINAVMVFMGPFSIIIMIGVSDSSEWSRYIYFSGIVLSIFPVGFILMNLKYTVVISLSLLILYLLVVGVGLGYYHQHQNFFLMTTFFVVSAIIAVILATYLLESNQKKIVSQKQQVEGLVEMKNRLINILAHDLRAPCNSIVGFSDLYIDGFETYKSSDARFFMQSINKSAHNLLSLLQNLLEWSKLQTKNYTFHPSVVHLDDLIAANIRLAKEAMELKSITLRQTKMQSGIQLFADRNMVDTVFRNLFSNAIKFTPKEGEIDLKHWSSGNLACVSITDNGVGIDEDRIRTLFKMETAKSTKGTADEAGSGLGLVLCHEFIMKNDGNIWVRSRKGKGSTFTFTLPLVKS